MKFTRWPHRLATFVVLCLAVLVLVTVETGSSARPTASASRVALPGLETGRMRGPGLDLGNHRAASGAGASSGAGDVSGADTAAGVGSGVLKAVPSKTAPPDATDPESQDAANDQAATGSGGAIAQGPGPGPDGEVPEMNPFNFRLGLINGTVVKPDARDWAARTVSTGPLLLFLPATGHVPDNYQRFLTVAARSGYHVLGLDFWNRGKSVARLCGVDPRCYTQVQRNRFNGNGPSHFSKVDEANSVLSRLHAALDYLVVHDPDGGWNQYTHDDSIQWSSIVVAGHSQGGGESAYIAHRHRVMGQLTFASPIITDEDTHASWLRTKSATPASVMYAFDDEHDKYYPRIVQSWKDLHLKRRLMSEVPVPTSSSVHKLVTTMNLGDGRESHLRSVLDNTPLTSDGTPVFEPVWKWMLARVDHDPTSSALTTN